LRYLSIDLGDKRTGLAAGDDVTSLVSPHAVLDIPRGDGLVTAIAQAIAGLAPDALVIGLPLNMDDSEGPAAATARAFGAELGARCGLPVHFQDERLTSFDADQHMARSGRTRGQKKKIRDALAAAAILRDFLDTRPPA
jgi:putative Holliday junction resolvase